MKKNSCWIYTKNSDNTARFVLGESGKRPLICFGVNCSTAEPEKLDRTVSRVRAVAKDEGFDGWIMLNIYPQRATDPNAMHQVLNSDLHKKNLKHIERIFCDYHSSTVWAAWGGVITARTFLRDCLKDIVKITRPYSLQWVHRGELTSKGHPHHPLYLRRDARFQKFDINDYLGK